MRRHIENVLSFKPVTAYVRMKKSEVDRVNALLGIEDVIETPPSPELKPFASGTEETVFFVEFPDGSTAELDLCLSDRSYYDRLTWSAPRPGSSEDVVFDSEYVLTDTEFNINGVEYSIKLVIMEDENG